MLSRKAVHDRMRDIVSKGTPTNQSKSNVSENAKVSTGPGDKPMTDKSDAGKKDTASLPTAKRAAQLKSGPPAKKAKTQNFLLMGAKKAKAARSARTAARVGCFERSVKKNKLSNTGSGVPLSKVVRLKYVKGFTQAVSTPCCLEDLE